ncbi:Serine/threonine-protein kinase PknA [Sedimentisphaera cyanobacteriorum]|uniref:Serine/threonine-protein kinase PknA n=1 Tax=Sedimentisphaera cyanobacteriorum TaxID=1940790 RepID=A0A1Q2HPZ5_9BACT|nr:serine/threonine-protein kinase [Sedimentisphaera cyanobacteriorum]AQQ09440.1 Serine/threonine-protein kinase PknA [Sedimentisphaera cyanobacteriorum]
MRIPGFTIRKTLGTGAKSTIYEAQDHQTGDVVALKRVLVEHNDDMRFVEQVDTELKVASQIDNKYIRKCYRVIKRRRLLKTTEVLMTMELFNGLPLDSMNRLSLIDVMLIFRMASIGLNEMHRSGFVHCDIKPNNILVNMGRGEIKIIDLGQSCPVGTVKARVQGTPDYIAPEQVRKQPITHRTDVFNLGAAFYWVLTGKKVPTVLPKQNDIAAGVGFEESKKPESPSRIYSKIPMTLSNLIMDCVNANPAERPSGMHILISRLDDMIKTVAAKRNGKNA